MKNLEIKVNSEKGKSILLSVPENWDELTKDQVLYIASLWQSWQDMFRQGMDMQKAKAKLFVCLILDKTKKELREIVNLLSLVDYDEMSFNILSLTDFVFERITLTKNHLPKFRTRCFQTFYGPQDQMKNSTIEEFSYVLSFYNRYNKTGEDYFLTVMIACLYRKKQANWEQTGDIRQPFNGHTADKYMMSIDALPYAKKQLIYLFFVGCVDAWAKKFPLVFNVANKEEQTSNKTFMDVILMMSGGKFGTFNETKSQNGYLILKELNNLIEEKETTKRKRP